jgi:hypothetical protein
VPHVARLAAWSAFVLLAAGAGCGGSVPVPSLPQLREVQEIGEYGTQRLRATDACRAKTTDVDAYVRCMADAGWAFIERGGPYPAGDCWSRRAAGDPGDLPPALCFHRAGEAPPAPTAPAP